MPDIRCREIIGGNKGKVSTFLDKLIADEPTIWHDLKEEQIMAYLELDEGKKAPSKILLIFDQFEELFTYPPEAVLAFRKQLAEALFTPLPSRYWDILELFGQEDSPLNEAEQKLLQKPLELRVIVAIRHDKIHLLDQLKDYLPTINKNCYNLIPLTLLQASQAIIAPAVFQGNFISPTYRYDEKAIKAILDYLTEGGTDPIEGTQLQIICHSLEKKVIEKQLKVVYLEDVGDLNEVIHNYYLEKIASVEGEAEQLEARKLVEEGLVYEDEQRRLSLYEGVILKEYHIKPATLQQLVDSHLLRAELSSRGGYTYELSHDTLVTPVLKAKRKRLEIERQAKAEHAMMESQRELLQLREKAVRERKRTLISIMLAGLFLAIAIFALNFYVKAKRAEVTALEAQQKSERIFAEFKNEQKKRAEESYFRHINAGDNFSNSEDFTGALSEYKLALEVISLNNQEIDSGGIKAKRRINASREIASTSKTFSRLIEDGNLLLLRGPKFYQAALAKYSEAEALGYQIQIARLKKKETNMMINESFEEQKLKGQRFFEIKDYKTALSYFKTANQLKPNNQYVKDKMKECNNLLK